MKELDSIIAQAKRPRIIEKLAGVRKDLATELNAVREKAERAKTARNELAAGPPSAPKRFEFELTNFAWDQSDKFIKIFLSLDGVHNTAEENVIVEFADKSLHRQLLVSTIRITNLRLTAYCLQSIQAKVIAK